MSAGGGTTSLDDGPARVSLEGRISAEQICRWRISKAGHHVAAIYVALGITGEVLVLLLQVLISALLGNVTQGRP